VITLPAFPGEYLKVSGVDLFTSEPFLAFELDAGSDAPREVGSGQGEKGGSIEKWMSTRNGIAVTQEFASRHQLERGDRIRVVANAREQEVEIVSILETRDSLASGQPHFAVMDIGWAQELLQRQGKLTSIQLQLHKPRELNAAAERLQHLLPPDLQVAPPRQRSAQMQTMLSAFQLNLTALSMVSLLVGTFLIYNTISASVARRRTEIGILRAIGASRTEVRALFLGEAMLLGVAGIVCGVAGGVALAQLLLGAVAKTISSLYLLVSIDRAYLNPLHVVAAAVLGLAAVIVGAWRPAEEAASSKPVDALSLGSYATERSRSAQGWPWMGVAFLVAAVCAALLALHVGPAALAFGSAFCVLVGFACFAPGATALAGRAASTAPNAPVLWRLAADNLHRSVHRNGVTVAGLAAAITLAIGLVVMIHSFRESVGTWIERGIIADLFIAPAANEIIGLSAFVPPEAIAWLQARQEVEAVDTFRERTITVAAAGEAPRPALLAVVTGAPRGNVQFLGGDSARKLERVFLGGEVAVTESFARRSKVKSGSRLRLLTPVGEREFTIAGVYADYTRDQGVILMARSTFTAFWDDPSVQSLAVYLRDGMAADPLVAAYREKFSRSGEFVIYANRDLRARVLTIFDQTFAITYVLRSVAIVVAIAGIFLSVTTLVAERERELGVLRAIGASAAQIHRMLMTESALIGAVASVLGIAAGCLLAVVLTWVVNPAFFGWSITLQIPWGAVLATPLWILPAAVLAAWYPAWRAGRRPVAAAVREE
jgi:putative ABC transport system permease protein